MFFSNKFKVNAVKPQFSNFSVIEQFKIRILEKLDSVQEQ